MAVGLKDAAAGTKEKRLPAYFSRLTPRAQRIYLKSDAIDRFDFTVDETALRLTRELLVALESGAPSTVQRHAQALLDELCRKSRLAPLQLQVKAVRPHNARGELHGIFYPRETGRSSANPYQFSTASSNGPLIILWMRTAQRHDIVKPRTFLRTLMHEFGHYLDYFLLRLGDSPHSSGFFRRESFLVRMLTQESQPTAASGPRRGVSQELF
ncbi:MAG TPA: hypothetical protein VMT61_13270 [Candidatus Binataceae bacterium]|nr:hypothetical protein [Candidatus Binataceae bacterium]